MKHAGGKPKRGDAAPSAARRVRRRWGLVRRLALFLAVGALVVVVGTTAVAYAVDRAEAGKVLPGVSVAGVNVGDMRPAQAYAAVQSKLDPQLERGLTISAGSVSMRVLPTQLGVQANVSGAVQQALSESRSTAWLPRAYHRLFDWSVSSTVDVHYSYPTAKVKALIAQLAAKIDQAPRDASLQATTNDMHVAYTSARTGRSLDQARARALLLGALRAQAATVRLPVATRQPRVSDARLGKTITVDLSTNTLQLYDGAVAIRSFPVATAMQPYSTPIGTWQVAAKDLHPVWVNPGTAWAKAMPKTIPPGPANPLGLRALALNAPGILIHGTPEDASIGHWASHGCIRMHEADALALYPLVPVGTKVIIFGAPPWGASAVAGSATGF